MKRLVRVVPAGDWRTIPNYGERYLVNALGGVWGYHFGSPLKGVVDHKGYPRVLIVDEDGRKRARLVHQLVMEAFVGPYPSAGMEIRHLDGDPSNNSLSNLAYGTKSENARDRLLHGTDANARKTHCKRGHAFDDANTRVRPDGSRKCRACDREAHRRAA